MATCCLLLTFRMGSGGRDVSRFAANGIARAANGAMWDGFSTRPGEQRLERLPPAAAQAQPRAVGEHQGAVAAKQRVQLIAMADFSVVSQIVVDLRSKLDAQTQAQFTFTTAGQSQLWESPGLPGQWDYEFRRTFMYKDGRVHVADSDWVPGPGPLLAVADELRFDLSVVPRLLDLGGTLRMVILELQSQAASPERQEQTTLVIKNKEDRLRWKFSIDSPDRHSYRYRFTAITTQGERQPAGGTPTLPKAPLFHGLFNSER